MQTLYWLLLIFPILFFILVSIWLSELYLFGQKSLLSTELYKSTNIMITRGRSLLFLSAWKTKIVYLVVLFPVCIWFWAAFSQKRKCTSLSIPFQSHFGHIHFSGRWTKWLLIKMHKSCYRFISVNKIVSIIGPFLLNKLILSAVFQLQHFFASSQFNYYYCWFFREHTCTHLKKEIVWKTENFYAIRGAKL